MKILKLEKPVHSGDWHDRPLKWEVQGPGNERQLFATKAEATTYKRIRKSAVSYKEAHHKYIFLG